MKVVVLGASGATGRLVVGQLADRNVSVRAVVRPDSAFPAELREHALVETVTAHITRLSDAEWETLLSGCDAVVSCLGHNITFRGIFGPPYRLVANAVKKITAALRRSGTKMKFILMSTVAYTDEGLGETHTAGGRLLFSILEALVPPHTDNMAAARHLIELGSSGGVEWVAVRPDGLHTEDSVSEYDLSPVTTRSPLFDPGKTSRNNTAHFMAELVVNDKLWQEWRYRTPVVYDRKQTPPRQTANRNSRRR